MNIRFSPPTSIFLLRVLGLGLLLFCRTGYGEPGVVPVHARSVTRSFAAYAEVIPLARTALRAAETGQVEGLHLFPGEAIERDAVLGHLRGPEVVARLARYRAAVTSAEATLRAARHLLAAERQKRAAHLSTRQAVYRAQAAQAQAEAQLTSARAALRAAKAAGVLRAPAAGTVLALAVENGERVEKGRPVFTLLPRNRLWLRAIYYGAAASAIHPGMRGRFLPADGDPPVAVEVVGVVPAVQADGGVAVDLRPVHADAHWRSGEAGTVRLAGPAYQAVTVPTRALILARGRWWVLLHTPHGDRRQAVTPGPSRGDETVIEQGLSAGAEVVVDNAYLRFHRDLSQHYQPPD